MNHLEKLRLVLRINAFFSLACGVVAVVAAGWVSRELGIDHVVITRLIGIGLVGWFVLVRWIAASEPERLLRETPLVSLGDLLWVIGTVVVLVAGILTELGFGLAVAAGLVVADLGVIQMVLLAKATAPMSAATLAA